MKIYDESKTVLIENPDLDKGHIEYDVIVTEHEEIPYIKEEGHYEIICEYPNGGKDTEWIVDVSGQEHVDAWTEVEEVQVYIPYTDLELEIIEIRKELMTATSALDASDYKTLKYCDGEYTDEEYEPIRLERQKLRVEIRRLEDKLAELEKEKENSK